MTAITATFEDSFVADDSRRNLAMVESVEGASMFAAINEGSIFFMPLGYRDDLPAGFADESLGGRADVWMSTDNVLFVTQYGQLVQTQKRFKNRTSTQFLANNPFEVGLLTIQLGRHYAGEISWQPGNHQYYPFTSTFKRVGRESLSLVLADVEVERIEEFVEIALIDLSYTNSYWVHPATGEVLKSTQRIVPNGDVITFETARPFNAESLR